MNKLKDILQTETHSKEDLTFRKASVFEDAQALASISGDNADKMAALLNTVVRRFKPLVAKIDFRRGVSTHSLNYLDPNLSVDHSRLMIDEWVDPQLIESQLPSPSDSGTLDPSSTEYSLNEDRFVVATVPVYFNETIAEGAVAVLLSVDSYSKNTVLSELESLTLAISLGESSSPTDGTTYPKSENQSLNILTRVSRFRSVKELGYALVNSIADRYTCEQVAMAESDRKRTKMLAISGVSDFKSNSPGVVLINQAMEECLDHQGTVVSQQRGEEELENDFRIHKTWSQATRDSAVCSIPLVLEEEVVGIVSLRRPRSMPFTQKECDEISSRIQGFGPAMELVKKANTTPIRIVGQSLRNGTRSFFQPRSWGRKSVFILLCAAIAYFFFGSTVYKPSCLATLVPQRQTQVSAPFESMLTAVHVQSGDHVKAGDLLLELDTRAFRLELGSINAQLGVSKVQMRNAIFNDEIAVAALERNKTASLEAKQRTLLHKINQSKIVAPVDCTITNCDLDNKIGQIFPIGEPMLSFAEPDHWRLEISVPDGIAAHIERDQSGVFISQARPDEQFQFCVSQINRSAEVDGGNNVFIARAELDGTREWMKVGMEGYAKIRTKSKPVWWVALHRIIDAARIQFWF
jgi:hypothetical protein